MVNMRYNDEECYEFETTIKFIDTTEAVYFAKLLESLSMFLDDYIEYFGGDNEITGLLNEVSVQILESVEEVANGK